MRSPSNRPRKRLTLKDVVRIDSFMPLSIRCPKCSRLAYMIPRWSEKRGECKCSRCAGIYALRLDSDYSTRYAQLPLWLKANFRKHVFRAVNADHLDHLERVIEAQLRERPVIQKAKIRERYKTNQNMPFNLPSWLLSAKNRRDLLKLIARLRKTIPRRENGF